MSIARRFLTVGGLTIVSRILGVVRESIFAGMLGDCVEMDVFVAASKFPVFFRRFFSEGGFQSIFVPYLTDFTATGKLKGARYFSSRIFTMVFWVVLICTIIVFIFAKEFSLLMAPGFANDPEKMALVTEFTRIIFPSVAFVSLSSIYSGILIASKKFFPFSMIPILMNVVLISSLLIGQDMLTAGRRMAYGFLVAGIFQLCYLYVCVRTVKLTMPRVHKVRASPKVKQLFKKLVPILAGGGVAQVNIFIDTLFGSFLPTGGMTHISFADRCFQLPLALFGISMATVLLPEIASCISRGKKEEVQSTQSKALLCMLRLTIPSAIALITMAYCVISALYGHGKYSENAVQKTANVLMVLSMGLPAYVVSKILSSTLMAHKDARTPLVAAIASIITNVVLSAALIVPFQEIGIAVATAVSGFVNAYVMYRQSKHLILLDKTVGMAVIKIVIASIGMYLAIEFIKHMFVMCDNSLLSEIIFVFFGCFVGCIMYVIMLCVLGDSCTRDTLSSIKKRFF